MPDFHITFTGHISWEGQANGLPKEIQAFMVIEADTKAGIAKAIEHQSNALFVAGGMAVSKTPAAIKDPSKLDLDRMFVPMHWITYVDTQVRRIQNVEVPEDDEGNPTKEAKQ